jgi:hypothetical protein
MKMNKKRKDKIIKISAINKIIVAVCCMICISCEPKMEFDITSVKKQLVVDGSIENNNYAQVLLTYNTGYFSDLDSASFRGLVASRAKIILSDGVRSEILTLTKDTNYFPPFVYKGNEILGKAGKTYTLIIIDEINTGTRDMDTIVATTTIPQPVKLDSVWFSPTSLNKGIIKGIVYDNPDEKNYYRTFTKIKGEDKRYIPTYIASFEDKYFNGQKFTFHLNKGLDSYIKPLYDIEFTKGDTINVKIANIDKNSYTFWYSYDQEILNSGNPFASNFERVKSNIQGGLGIWCGYGSTIYFVVAK